MEKTLFKEGQAYFFRTEQYDYVGTVIGRYDGFLFLKDAFLIKDTGRLEYTIKTGVFLDVNRLSDILHLKVANIEAFIEFNPK
jgi:hypothetical protein